MNLRRCCLWLFALLVSLGLRAQFDVHFTHYWALHGYYNPAVAGAAERLNLFGTYSLQMAGYTNAPRTMLVGADMALPTEKKNQAVGAGLFSETIGLFNNQRLFAQYAYRFNLWNGKLSLGVNAGMLDQSFNASKLDLEESNDDAFPKGQASGSALDLGIGAYYVYRNFYVGLASMHLTAPTLKLGETNEIKIDRFYYLNSGCNIQLNNPLLSIQPSLQVMTDAHSFRADITARGTYQFDGKKYYAGLTYSPLTSVAFLLGGEINSVSFGYAYELYTSGVGVLNGSHDIYVGYVMDLDLFKKGRNKHKSIRIL